MSREIIRLLKKEFKLPIEVCKDCKGEGEITTYPHDIQEFCNECKGKGYKTTHMPADKSPTRPKVKKECLKCGSYNKSLVQRYKCFIRSSCPVAYDEWMNSRARRDYHVFKAKLTQKRDKSL